MKSLLKSILVHCLRANGLALNKKDLQRKVFDDMQDSYCSIKFEAQLDFLKHQGILEIGTAQNFNPFIVWVELNKDLL